MNQFERAALRLTVALQEPGWTPRRSHLAETRNELQKAAEVVDELVAALKDIVREIRAYQSPECDDPDMPGATELKTADAAIAKAEGK